MGGGVMWAGTLERVWATRLGSRAKVFKTHDGVFDGACAPRMCTTTVRHRLRTDAIRCNYFCAAYCNRLRPVLLSMHRRTRADTTRRMPHTERIPKTMADQKTTVSIAGNEIEYSTLPVQSLVALLQRGINHVLGNEVASKVSTAKRAVKGGDGPDKDEPKYTDAELEALENETYDAKVKAILEGELGVRVAGVAKATPFEKVCRDVAWLMIENSPGVKNKSVKLPHGKGSGEARKAMIDNLMANEKLRAIVEGKARERMAEEAALGDLLSQ